MRAARRTRGKYARNTLVYFIRTYPCTCMLYVCLSLSVSVCVLCVSWKRRKYPHEILEIIKIIRRVCTRENTCRSRVGKRSICSLNSETRSCSPFEFSSNVFHDRVWYRARGYFARQTRLKTTRIPSTTDVENLVSWVQ